MSSRIALTDLAVRGVKPPSSGTITLWDSTIHGLGLRCSQGGTKTFVVMAGRARTRVRIGHYPDWSVKDARAEALRIIADRSRRPEPKRVLLEQVFDTFRQTHLETYRPRTRRETERLLQKHVISVLGKRAIGSITTEHLTRIIDGLIKTPGTCDSVHDGIRLLFRWAVRRRIIDRSPLEGLSSPVKLRPRERVLTDDELRKVYQAAAAQGCNGGKIVLLLILTGQRRGEIAALRGEYVNREARNITLPAELTKNRRVHSFPYGDMVAAILDDLPREGLLFPARGTDNEHPYNGWSKLKAGIDGTIPHWTLHDLRRTFATNLAELEVPPHVIERLLNHITGIISGVAAIYNRYSFKPQMVIAIQKWEAKLQVLLSNTENTND